MTAQRILILGGGISGLVTAARLADMNYEVILADKAPFLGGHVSQYACKATGRCVKCGACLLENHLAAVNAASQVHTLVNTRLTGLNKQARFSVTLSQRPQPIDTVKCSACGDCALACPSDGAIVTATSAHHRQPWAIDINRCLFFDHQDCRLCAQTCPDQAIRLDPNQTSSVHAVDAIVLATGFNVFDPTNKPYGFQHWPDVLTNFELDASLRRQGCIRKRSNHEPPRSMAFIQCVGSRDAQLKNLWCSKTCCGATIRMANKLKALDPDLKISIFYIDIQSFGKDFADTFKQARNDFDFIRALPADIYCTEEGQLQLSYFNPLKGQNQMLTSDMVVLAVGQMPNADNQILANQLGLALDDDGFFPRARMSDIPGLFKTGTACGPKSIAECIIDADRTVWAIDRHLKDAVA
jgi:heterodisulfide reductase subunit A